MVNSESSSSHDIWTFKDVKKSSVLEYVTPYKICVVVLINEMCALKSKCKSSPGLNPIDTAHLFVKVNL